MEIQSILTVYTLALQALQKEHSETLLAIEARAAELRDKIVRKSDDEKIHHTKKDILNSMHLHGNS